MPPNKQQTKAAQISKRKEKGEKRRAQLRKIWKSIKRGGSKISQSEFFRIIVPMIASEAAGAVSNKYVGDEGSDIVKEIVKNTGRQVLARDGDSKGKVELAEKAIDQTIKGYGRHKDLNDKDSTNGDRDERLKEHRVETIKGLAELYHHHQKLDNPKPSKEDPKPPVLTSSGTDAPSGTISTETKKYKKQSKKEMRKKKMQEE